MLFTMGNVGLPGTSGFVGEFLTLMGAFQANTWAAFFGATGVILSACYALWLYKRVVFGDEIAHSMRDIVDVNRRELVTLVPLVIATLALGVYPSMATDYFAPAVTALLDGVEADLAAWHALAPAVDLAQN
jgi:NADH-quinone oxidoreductase subunit M